VLVSPRCVVEAWVRGLVVSVLAVLPNWILLSLDTYPGTGDHITSLK
jgi:hypothetical protein